jgi:hypothetical protein
MTDTDRLLNFKNIAIGSSGSFHALRVLVSHIGGLADKYDEGTVLAFETVLSNLFPSLGRAVKKMDTKAEPDKERCSELSAKAPSTPADTVVAESGQACGLSPFYFYS